MSVPSAALRRSVLRYMRLYDMTERQATAYALEARGQTLAQIGGWMGIARSTVMHHLHEARRRRARS